jgi:hypothetical protein
MAAGIATLARSERSTTVAADLMEPAKSPVSTGK